jgi:hypothetical protein
MAAEFAGVRDAKQWKAGYLTAGRDSWSAFLAQLGR